MSSVVCPLPTAHTYADVKATYDKVRKAMPGLTPAAWRKAAAQELGIDYDTFLAIWKTKGKQALTPESTPTTPASAGPGATMSIKQAPPKSSIPTGVETDLLKDVDDIVKDWEKGLSTQDEALQHFLGVKNDVQLYLHVGEKISAATIKKIDDAISAIKNGTVVTKMPVKKAAPKPPTTATTAAKADDLADQVDDLITTKFGALDNSLAKAAYNKMKVQMPGASPAVLRKAAAEYLGVDYKDYLVAWKKKPGKPLTPTSKKAVGEKDAPPTVSPTTAGKYANKDITADELKAELARLFGPGANKDYIALQYNSSTGIYQVMFPKSLLSQSAMKKVAEELRKLGLYVEKSPTGNLHSIKAGGFKKPTVTAGDQYKVIKGYGGEELIDMNSANAWTNRWWNTIDSDVKHAWGFYTGSGYRGLNAWLRGIPPYQNFYTGPLDTLKTYSKQLSQSMRAVDKQFTVFRGSNAKLSDFKVGNLWSDKGFTSTSINPAGGFGGNVRFKIICPPGTKGMYIGRKSSHPGENEFLLDKNTQFRVLEVDGNEVTLVVIPKKK